jgi:hypothetical protein
MIFSKIARCDDEPLTERGELYFLSSRKGQLEF